MTLKTELFKRLVKEHDIKTTDDISRVLKEMFSGIIQETLNAEYEEQMGYSKYDKKKKPSKNSRNGYSKKKVRSELGETELLLPRDRESMFDPQIVKKNQTNITGIENQIISLYSRGLSVSDINEQVKELYGVEISESMVSRITDKIYPVIAEWQNRELEKLYPIIFLDAIHYKVRSEGRIINKACYIIIGVNLSGFKDVLGVWIGENESAKFWLNVLNDIKTRGVEDIFISSVDNLTGFSEALKAVFPKVDIQKCIIHQIRNSTKYIPYQDRKEFCKDLKTVYQAVNEEIALNNLGELENKWGKKYLIAIQSWERNWKELSTFLKYPPEIRKLIYTTNTIESYNRQLRKVTKTKSVFPTDKSLEKIIYLATMNITKKWTQRVRKWSQILLQFQIIFEERLNIHLEI